MTEPTRVQVRDAGPADLEIVADFNARLAAETESKALDPAILARGVAAALADPDRLRYWLAEAGGVVVGQAAATREWSDWRAGWAWWLQSVYVLPEHRGAGVLRALLAQIRAAARTEPDVIGLRLYVEQENQRAQATYRALGLRPAGYLVYEDLWPDRYGAGSG